MNLFEVLAVLAVGLLAGVAATPRPRPIPLPAPVARRLDPYHRSDN